MAEWKEPKSDYEATDQVTPDIFNTLATNEKYLKEITCECIKRPTTGTDVQINGIVFVEV